MKDLAQKMQEAGAYLPEPNQRVYQHTEEEGSLCCTELAPWLFPISLQIQGICMQVRRKPADQSQHAGGLGGLMEDCFR